MRHKSLCRFSYAVRLVGTMFSTVILCLLIIQCGGKQEEANRLETEISSMADSVAMADTTSMTADTVHTWSRPPIEPVPVSETGAPPPPPPPPPPNDSALTDSRDSVEVTDPAFYMDSVLEHMESASMAFNVPDSQMNLGESRTIQLLVDMQMPTPEALAREIAEPGPVETHTVRVHETMEARLTGAGFEITAVTPEIQAISCVETTEWKWDIKAVEKGEQKLHLTLNAIVDIDGSSRQRSIRTFDHYIDVRVSLGKQVLAYVDRNKQWLWAAIVLPIGTAVWAWIHRRRKKPWRRDQ